MNKDKHVSMASIIKELAAKYIQHESNTDPLITVTNVDLSRDWKRAVIMITTIPDDRIEDALIFLKRSASDMRDYFKKRGRMRHIPHLEFMLDAGEKHRQHMDEIVREIDDQKK